MKMLGENFGMRYLVEQVCFKDNFITLSDSPPPKKVSQKSDQKNNANFSFTQESKF